MLHELLNKILTSVEYSERYKTLTLICSDGTQYRMLHHQDCCESVYLESGLEDLQRLIGQPLLKVEESTQDGDVSDGTELWTFYHFATFYDSACLRWNGTSNGYYSVDVSFEKIT